MRKIFILGAILVMSVGCFGKTKSMAAKTEKLHIVLDAGHGGEESGAETTDNGEIILEKDLNLKIAKYLKEELEKYENVTVGMTRDNDATVGLSTRPNLAVEEGADILISIHNNAYGEICEYDNGCTVLVSKGQYKEEIAKEEQKLGVNILHELSSLGIKSRGLLLRTSEDGATYPNGAIKDYYAIVNAGIREGIPAIIIEHAFMDNKTDYENFLNSDEKLHKIAKADARGIARYYRLALRDTGEVLEKLSNIEETLVWVKTGKAKDNEISTKVFYKDESVKSTKQSEEEKVSQSGKSEQEKVSQSDKNEEEKASQSNKSEGKTEQKSQNSQETGEEKQTEMMTDEIKGTEAKNQNLQENSSEQLEEQSKENIGQVRMEQRFILGSLVVILVCAVLLLMILLKRRRK